MPGSKQTTTTAQTTRPWQEGQLQGIVDRAGGFGQNPSNFSTIYGDTTQSGIQDLRTIAGQGSRAEGALGNVVNGSGAGYNAGLGQLMNTANGGMYNNPYLNDNLGRALDATQSRINGMFSGAGRTGSGQHEAAVARGLSDTASSAYLDQYNRERVNQLSASNQLYDGGYRGAGMAGQLDASRTWGADQMLRAGGLQDQIANDQRTAGMRGLEWESGMVRPIGGMGGRKNETSTVQQQQSPLQTALGIGMLGASLFGTGGLMPGVGGSLGGLLGGGGRASPWNSATDLPWTPVSNPRYV